MSFKFTDICNIVTCRYIYWNDKVNKCLKKMSLRIFSWLLQLNLYLEIRIFI